MAGRRRTWPGSQWPSETEAAAESASRSGSRRGGGCRGRPRHTGKSPEQPAADGQDQRQEQQLWTADFLGPAFAVIPGEEQRDKEADHKRQGDAASQSFRPAELLGNNVDPLQECESRRDVGDRPLHQLALPQALQEFIHVAVPTLLLIASLSARKHDSVVSFSVRNSRRSSRGNRATPICPARAAPS